MKRFIPIVIVISGSLAGCASDDKGKASPVDTGPSGALKGKATLDGKSIGIGTVVAVSGDKKRSGRGNINPDGSYVIDKAPAGPVNLYLELPVPPAPKLPPGGKLPPDMPKGYPPDATEEQKRAFDLAAQVPPRYLSPEESRLTTKIKEGASATFNLNLTSR